MFAKKFECLERSKANVFAQTPARPQMNQCDPRMLSVPHDWRDRANDKNPEQPIQTRSFEFLAESRSKSENEQDTHHFDGVDPSAQKSKADKQSSQKTVNRKMRTLFNRTTN